MPTLAEARAELGIGSDTFAEEARKAYRKLALQWHPDKNGGSPEATAKFQRIQDAYTRIQEAEETGRWDDDEEDDFDDDFGPDDDFLHAVFEQMFFSGAGFGSFSSGPFGRGGDFAEFCSQGCVCPECVFDRQQATAERREYDWRRQQEARQERARSARREQQEEQRQRNRTEFEAARARAAASARGGGGGSVASSAATRPAVARVEKLRLRGNKAVQEGHFARAATQYTAALKELGGTQPAAGDAEATPTRTVLLSNRSLCYAKLERYDAALTDADACVALRSGWDKAHARRAVALNGLGRHGEAAAAFEAAAECCKGPDSTRAGGDAEAAQMDGYRHMAVEAHAAAEAKEKDAAERARVLEEAERERHAVAAQRKALEEQRKADVAEELRVACERSSACACGGGAGDSRDAVAFLEKALAAAQRVGVSKEELKAARAVLRRCAKADEERASHAQRQHEARMAAESLRALVVAGRNGDVAVTRSALKTAIRKAETSGVEALDGAGAENGASLLQMAREQLAELKAIAVKAEEAAAAERAAAEEAKRAAVERAAAEAERVAAERAAVERAAAVKANAERVASEKALAEWAAAQRAAAERAKAEQAAAERAAAKEAERVAAEMAAVERAAEERARAERVASEKAVAEWAAAERAAAERANAEVAAAERAAAETAAAERAAAARNAAAEEAKADVADAERAAAKNTADKKAAGARTAAQMSVEMLAVLDAASRDAAKVLERRAVISAASRDAEVIAQQMRLLSARRTFNEAMPIPASMEQCQPQWRASVAADGASCCYNKVLSVSETSTRESSSGHPTCSTPSIPALPSLQPEQGCGGGAVSEVAARPPGSGAHGALGGRAAGRGRRGIGAAPA